MSDPYPYNTKTALKIQPKYQLTQEISQRLSCQSREISRKSKKTDYFSNTNNLNPMKSAILSAAGGSKFPITTTT